MFVLLPRGARNFAPAARQDLGRAASSEPYARAAGRSSSLDNLLDFIAFSRKMMEHKVQPLQDLCGFNPEKIFPAIYFALHSLQNCLGCELGSRRRDPLRFGSSSG
jgi:hypothetical protein